MLNKQNILGVGITSDKSSTILEYVIDQIHGGTKKLFIVTPNPEILFYAKSHLAYKDKLNSADIALADGIGVILASRLLGLPIQERTTGVDFIEQLCEMSREKPISMGFLGGRSNVAELAAECLKQKYPWIDVVFTGEEWDSRGFKIKDLRLKNDNKDEKILNPKSLIVNQPQIDILFVAYGFPKQEEWIYDNLATLPVKAAMGVGGAFDYLSGSVPRAPKFMRRLGFEWLYRLTIQPWRLKRQVALLKFIVLILKERFTHS
ncbi:MAG: WecB/TagA/CpsF family glycosyltransferase [Candidatus Levybacteria bacterium]|nr:WecB/TagA/CpsF family glycosyltransferase [Candidatus Levybacteria bacterium]